MKTILPAQISSVTEAEAFLKALIDNGESFHPEESAFDIIWNLPANQQPDHAYLTQLEKLRQDIYALPELTNYPNCPWEPCGFMLDYEAEMGREKKHFSDLKKGDFFRFPGWQRVYTFMRGGSKKGFNYEADDDINHFKTTKTNREVVVDFEY